MTNYVRFPILIPLVVCVACVVELALAYTYPPTAARFPILIGYLTLAATTFLMVAALGPNFMTQVIGLPTEDIGYVVGPAGIGVFAGALLVTKLARQRQLAGTRHHGYLNGQR
ncbi:MAG: hypothetical protein K6T83_16515, partial [Alicyclobacillus sp.]|nr:hypothetical protein [Alicyclobacillus sp.]